ncbi:MAG TPA: hypothetical protein VNO30_15260 [Kofleriaceae bacterium]|nr:hypothetical protein [Kofleriaceae bacterium]
MLRDLPFFSYANEAKGVIAIGNSARGVLAIGGSVSVGVISIGTNAIGVVALGLNAAGPISLALINGGGVLSWAGVNVIGGVGASYVNAFVAPWLGVVLAVVGLVIGQLIHVPRAPRPDAPAGAAGSLAKILEAAPGVYWVVAGIEPCERGFVLTDGPLWIEAYSAETLVRGSARRARCQVRVIEEFDHQGTYRDAATKRRRLMVQSIEPLPEPPRFLHVERDLSWLLARSLQAVSLVAGAICAALALAG